MSYSLTTLNHKTERRLSEYLTIREDIEEKLNRLRENPRRANGAHSLHGKLKGKWSCWLGSDIRMIYTISDEDRLILVYAVGSHKFTRT